MRGIFLDIESNGLDFYRHHVVEIAFKIVDLKSGQCEASFESNVKLSQEQWAQSDLNSLKINGWTSPNLAHHEPDQERVADAIIELFLSLRIHRDNAIYICQNPSFDRPFFAQLIKPYLQEEHQWPYHWLDLASMFWAKFSNVSGVSLMTLSKDSIASFLQIEPEQKPHRAMRGVEHLILCYEKLIGWSNSKPKRDLTKTQEGALSC